MYTTSITLRRAWLTDPLNPTVNPIVCGTQRPSSRTDAQDGTVRQYSGGRRQGHTSPVGLTTIPIVLVGLNWAQWRIVLDWIASGKVILFRSAAGERHYVTMFELNTDIMLKTSMHDGRAFNVTVSLYPVTFDENVE